MAVAFLFAHRGRGYQAGCGLLLLAAVLGVFGVASPGWYSVRKPGNGTRFYSHLWIVCSHGLSGCHFLKPELTKGQWVCVCVWMLRGCVCVCVCVCVCGC